MSGLFRWTWYADRHPRRASMPTVSRSRGGFLILAMQLSAVESFSAVEELVIFILSWYFITFNFFCYIQHSIKPFFFISILWMRPIVCDPSEVVHRWLVCHRYSSVLHLHVFGGFCFGGRSEGRRLYFLIIHFPNLTDSCWLFQHLLPI